MTTLNGLNHDNGSAVLPVLRRCGENVVAAVKLLVRPPRCAAPLWPLNARQSAIGAAIFVAVMLLLMTFVDAAEVRGVALLPHWMPWLFDQITDYGKSGWFLWPVGLAFLFLAALPSSPLTRMSQVVMAALMVRVGFLFLAVGAPGLFVAIIKRMIGRARPMIGGGLHPFLFEPFAWNSDFASLPSGHTTTVFSVVVAFGTLFPRARTVLWLYALAILVSRLMVTAHYPSDVLAGAVVGAGGAILVRRFFALRRLGFSLRPDGTVHQLPGPSRRRIKAVARELLAP